MMCWILLALFIALCVIFYAQVRGRPTVTTLKGIELELTEATEKADWAHVSIIVSDIKRARWEPYTRVGALFYGKRPEK